MDVEIDPVTTKVVAKLERVVEEDSEAKKKDNIKKVLI